MYLGLVIQLKKISDSSLKPIQRYLNSTWVHYQETVTQFLPITSKTWDHCIIRHSLRYYRHSGLVIYRSKLPAPSVSMPCDYLILQSPTKGQVLLVLWWGKYFWEDMSTNKKRCQINLTSQTIMKTKWSHLGLNQGLPDYESGALTDWAIGPVA